MTPRHHHLISLLVTTIFLVFLSPHATHAEESVTRSHLIIAADHSGSMHNSYAINVETDAIIGALDSFVSDCGNTTISYIAWGSKALPPISVPLNDKDARYDLMIAISDLSRVNLSGTSHTLGLLAAVDIVDPSEHTIVVFLTDDVPGRFDIGPLTFELHKVGIFGPEVADSLRDEFLPGQGTVHEVASTTELEMMMKDLLEAARIELCLG